MVDYTGPQRDQTCLWVASLPLVKARLGEVKAIPGLACLLLKSCLDELQSMPLPTSAFNEGLDIALLPCIIGMCRLDAILYCTTTSRPAADPGSGCLATACAHKGRHPQV